MFDDETWIAVSVVLAYKYIQDYEVNLRPWAMVLQVNLASFVAAEITFLQVIDYRLWVPEDDYLRVKGRLVELWEKVFKGATRTVEVPTFLVRLGRLF